MVQIRNEIVQIVGNPTMLNDPINQWATSIILIPYIPFMIFTLLYIYHAFLCHCTEFNQFKYIWDLGPSIKYRWDCSGSSRIVINYY